MVLAMVGMVLLVLIILASVRLRLIPSSLLDFLMLALLIVVSTLLPLRLSLMSQLSNLLLRPLLKLPLRLLPMLSLLLLAIMALAMASPTWARCQAPQRLT